jgi:hypothetical protein
MVDSEDGLACTVIVQEISNTSCYLNEDFWELEDLYPEKKKKHQLSVSDFIEAIFSYFVSITHICRRVSPWRGRTPRGIPP